MTSSANLVSGPTSTNVYVSALTGDTVFRSGYEISYGFENETLWNSFGAITSFNNATASWAAVANITFREISNYSSAQRSTTTWVESLISLTGNDAATLGQHSLPGTDNLQGEFNYTHPSWTSSSLVRGGYGHLTLLHEIGHGLGLEHPHPETGSVGTKFPGVTSSEDVGTFGLNQGVWTVMTYNDGLQEIGTSPSDDYGWSLTPMAFDIAAIQLIYGANTTAGAGNSSYTVASANVSGTGYAAIWDTSGTDTISSAGVNEDVTIDLRAATLLSEEGGGGWLSHTDGIYGGFTIANGVVIENATGGNGSDRLTGNSANNRLDGGAGLDTVSYAAATSAVSINLATGTASGTGVGTDTLVGVENARGGSGNDTLIAIAGVATSVSADQFKPQSLVATSTATAIILDGHFGTAADAHIGNATTTPHATVQAIASGGFDYYMFTVTTADSAVSIDIDATYGLDTIVTLVRADGSEVASNDDGSVKDAGSTSGSRGSTLDSFVTAALAAGTYFVKVGRFNDDPVGSGTTGPLGLNAGQSYTLHVSLANAPIASGTVLLGSILDGGAGNDSLQGGTGIDVLIGGAGDDSYIINDASDVVSESAAAGTDRVEARGNYYLAANIEQLVLGQGAGDIYGVGNDMANTVTGNEGANLLLGGAGDDVVNGADGADRLFGEAGADTLNGDAGADYLAGGAGNDILNGLADADQVHGEAGDDIIDGGAGSFTDLLTGGDGNDVIRAASGQGEYDILNGAAGDDVYYIDSRDDIIYEGANEGTDTVYASIAGEGYYLWAHVDNLVLEGSTPYGVGNELNNSLTGNAVGNYLLGGAGNDTLNGKGGNDVLFGEAGADIFVFDRGTAGDVIGDFQRGSDRVDVRAFGLTFAQLQSLFVQVANDGAIRLDGGDLIVFHNTTMNQLTAADFILG